MPLVPSSNVLGFYHDYDLDGYLSNWYEAPFTYLGHRFCRGEQVMMWTKARVFGDATVADKILHETDSAKIKSLGKEVRPYDEDLWAQVRGPLMRVALREKFLQNPALREQLLSTGNALLVEAAPRDGVWGAHMGLSDPNLADPATWDGKNLLGQTLMDVRSDLRGWARDLAGKSLDADGLALGSELADMTLAQVYRLPEAHVLVRAYACICAFRQDLRWTNSREFLGAQHGTLAQIDDAIRAGATDALPADGWHQLIHELDLRILAQSLGAR